MGCIRRLLAELGITFSTIASGLAAILVTSPSDAAFEFIGLGARAGGMGDACSATVMGAEGLFWNPASIVWQQGFGLSACMARPYGFPELETQSLSAAWGGRKLGLAGGLTVFGPEAYREVSAIAGLAWRPSRRVSLGTAIRRLSLSVFGVGDRQWFVFDLGLCATAGETTRMSLWARNAGGTAIDLIGQGGSAALSCRTSARVWLSAEVSKEAGLPTGLGVGLEFEPHKGIRLRGGAGGEPERMSIGFGLARGACLLDYAAIHHTVLGLSHRISVSLQTRGRDTRSDGVSSP
jgi:hypothetical protein